jgi:hypothetical protein
MSTSPSWFDKEKFTRLVKKVGPKGASEPAPAVPSGHAPGPLNGPVTPAAESVASTTRISLVSKPPSILSEQRTLPALPRRTTPLPGLKALFQNPAGDAPPVAEMPSVITQPIPDISAEPAEKSQTVGAPAGDETAVIDPLSEHENDLDGIWQKMALLNEELAQTIQERDHAVGDINQLRDQLRLTEEMLAKTKGAPTVEDLAQLIRDRDNALTELDALKEKGAAESGKLQLPEGVTKTRELVFLAQERDQARKEYAELRRQFESLKREQSPGGPPPLPREDMSKLRKDLEQQIEGFRQKLEERNQEIAALKAAAAAASPPLPVAPATGEGSGSADVEQLRNEIAQLKTELAKAKDDASIAQRGLALSQKALQETRDALREATEGTSLSRHNFDNLKNECASLTQQNSVLQAQNEQLSRELAAIKQRKSGRLS